MKLKRLMPLLKLIAAIPALLPLLSCSGDKNVSLKKEFSANLTVLCDELLKLQNNDIADSSYGALYCNSCGDFHTRASESVLPFTVAYRETGNKKYLNAALATAGWLIKQQKPDGSWFETPSEWTGTTTDQLLMLAAAYPLIQKNLSSSQNDEWRSSIKAAADWLVKNMNHEFASINYCATTTATLMVVFRIFPDPAYENKADELAEVVSAKFDEDYFLTGEGNRILNTKYGIDLGYNMDMSLWGLGLYARLRGNNFVENLVKKSLERALYFVYPDGSTDNSWGVRSSKWTTFGSFTADGSQILFSMFASENPAYRTAALANLNYFMKLRMNGLITYGPDYKEIFNSQPCIYPTFCRAKNLAMSLIYGNMSDGKATEIPTQKYSWSKYFKTIDVALVRTENFMATVTAYRYKDIRRGADFKYMHRPSGGSVTNLWVKDYGYLQASGQTEYSQWEFNYPEMDSAVSITPRIEFSAADKNGENKYYTNLYDFDSHMSLSQNDGVYTVEAFGEMKDRNRWEGGVAYKITNIFSDDSVEKVIDLRYHGQRPVVKIVEPIVQHGNTEFKKADDHTLIISDGKREFIFELLSNDLKIATGSGGEKFGQPFPALKGYPVVINVYPEERSFQKEIRYRIKINRK